MEQYGKVLSLHLHHQKEMWTCSYYSELAGHENAAKYQTILFLAGSASAEFFADIGLCPFEAVKVRNRHTASHGLEQMLPIWCEWRRHNLHACMSQH